MYGIVPLRLACERGSHSLRSDVSSGAVNEDIDGSQLGPNISRDALDHPLVGEIAPDR